MPMWTKFQRNQAGSVWLSCSTNCPGPFLEGGGVDIVAHNSQSYVSWTTPNLGRRMLIIDAHKCFRFPICCSVLIARRLKSDVSRTSRLNLAFLIPCKNYWGTREMSECIVCVRTMTQPHIYFWSRKGRTTVWKMRGWGLKK